MTGGPELPNRAPRPADAPPDGRRFEPRRPRWDEVGSNKTKSLLLLAGVFLLVILMGWLGPHALAAGALGTNLYFALLIFGIGLVSATSPVAARRSCR